MDRPSRRIAPGSGIKKPASTVRPAASTGERPRTGSGVVRPKGDSGIRKPAAEAPARPSGDTAMRRKKEESAVRRAAAPQPPPPPPEPAPAPVSQASDDIDLLPEEPAPEPKKKGAPVRGSRVNPPSSKLRARSTNPVEIASQSDPLTASAARARQRGRSGAKGGMNPMMIYGGVGLVVLVLGAFVAMNGGKPSAGNGTTTTTAKPGAPLVDGIAFVPHDITWTKKLDGVWIVSGSIENRGKMPATGVVVAFYPVGEEARVKAKDGTHVAIVCYVKIGQVGSGQIVPFTTLSNPPAINPENPTELYPEKKIGPIIACKEGDPLPQLIQEAIYDPLDRDDWGGVETEWQKKRKSGFQTGS